MKFPLLLAFVCAGASSLAQISINREEIISIGGIKQYITLQGSDQSLPLLLFLHGGPGGSVMDYSHRFTDELQKHFIVVQWDQRETGRTKELNASPVPLSLSVFQNDTRELIDFLLGRFQRQKLYLAGHSWGTALGFYVAENYPGRLYAYLSIGPMIDQLESERIGLDLMKEKALKEGNKQAFTELSSVHIPFQNGEQLYYHRKWALNYSASRKKLSRNYVDEWAGTWLAVFNEASKVNLMESLPSVQCPLYFFTGRHDIQTSASITERYYTHVTAPKKALFWFERSGHGVPTSEPGRLQRLIIENVLPETFVIQKPAAVIGQSQ
jgi:pimeloyl-ACP methyl ester carboxylesterase